MKRKLALEKHGKAGVLLEESVSLDAVLTVGTNPGATIQVSGSDLSPEQFVLLAEGEEIVLLNSANGTSLNTRELYPGSRAVLHGHPRHA